MDRQSFKLRQFEIELAERGLRTACCVQPPRASLTLEVLGLLVIDQNLEVVKVALAVIAPGPGKSLFDVRVLALCFTHCQLLRGLCKDN